jgi:hypothetical protein
MKRAASLGVFVVAVLATQMCSLAQDAVPESTEDISIRETIARRNSLTKFSAKRTGDAKMPENSFNGFAMLRQSPDLGAPGSSGNGFHHFPLPMDKYTNWYRPRAATLTPFQRCAPDTFRPRGYGHLFASPCDGFRMEYQPYSLSDGMSMYGPAYIARMPDPRCEHCDHAADDCEDCRK